VAPCDVRQYGAPFLLYHHSNVFVPDDASGTMKQVEEDKLYAPLVMINANSTAYEGSGTPSCKSANGVMYEGFNLLTNRYRARFTPSVTTQTAAEYYVLPTKTANQSNVTMEIVSAKGECTVSMITQGDAVGFQLGSTHYTAQAFGAGYIKVSPPLPVSESSGTVTVSCEREGLRVANRIFTASQAIWFGGTQNKRGGTRLFLANKATATLAWSDVDNPFYFPENNYMAVGDTSQQITALEKQGDMLVIFKEREIFYTTYVQGDIDAEAIENGTNADVTAAQAYFPLTQLSPSIGCRCEESVALCRDRLVWMDRDARVYTLVPTGAYSERNVREIGQKIRPWLLEHTTVEERRCATAADHQGKYRLMIGSHMAEFDYNDSGFVNVAGYASGEKAARNMAWFVHRFDGFATSDRVCLISDSADRALLITTLGVSRLNSLIRVLYRFESQKEDRYLTFDNVMNAQTEQHPIASALTTKTYDFGDPVAYKRLQAFYPMMQTDGARIRFISDGVCPAGSDGQRYCAEDTRAHLVLPCIHRCRTFGLRIDAIGAMCIKGMMMKYTMFGNVK